MVQQKSPTVEIPRYQIECENSGETVQNYIDQHSEGSLQNHMINVGGIIQKPMFHLGGTGIVILQNASQESPLICQPLSHSQTSTNRNF